NAYRMRGFQLGYKPWKRGDRLGYYNGRYREVDYRAYRMKAPPRGYHYVQDDKGDIILAAIATGLIAAIIANN
ncbi:MAG TPA: RcnB family protein, partial [Hyphomonadaceae bacterium]